MKSTVVPDEHTVDYGDFARRSLTPCAKIPTAINEGRLSLRVAIRKTFARTTQPRTVLVTTSLANEDLLVTNVC